MKKKLLAISLITAMVICNSMTVWAADTWGNSTGSDKYTVGTEGVTTDGTNSGTKNVTATFEKAKTATYSVTITWDNLSFKYNDKLDWKGNSYEGVSADAWVTASDTSKKMNKIAVNNASDKKVMIGYEFIQHKEYIVDECLAGVFNTSGTITDTTNSNYVVLGTVADDESDDTAKNVFFGVSGKPTNVKFTNDVVNDLKIGTVTIYIYPYTPPPDPPQNPS